MISDPRSSPTGAKPTTSSAGYVLVIQVEKVELRSRLPTSHTHTHARARARARARTHTHTHPFNGPLSGTTRVGRYQNGKINLDLLKQETVSGSGISWAICKPAPRSRQITMPVHHHSVFTGRMPFLQCLHHSFLFSRIM